MSLFLGKIHYWLFNKVLWFEGLEGEIIKLAKDKGIDVEKLEAEINSKYGAKTPNKNLEDMIDTSNIHGWLQGKIHSAEGRMAAWTKVILENNQDYILDMRKVYENQGVNAANEAKRNGTLNDELQQFDLEYIKSLPVDECHKALQNFMGVGAKVADCIMLFSMSKHSAFPVDVWIKRAMIHFYLAPDVSLNKIRVFGREKFGELAGLAQQYLFYYARENNIKVE